MYSFVKWVMSFLYNSKSKQNNKDKHNQIMEKVGDYSFFNKEDIVFLHTLPKENLIQIIQIYNVNYTENIISLLNENKNYK